MQRSELLQSDPGIIQSSITNLHRTTRRPRRVRARNRTHPNHSIVGTARVSSGPGIVSDRHRLRAQIKCIDPLRSRSRSNLVGPKPQEIVVVVQTEPSLAAGAKMVLIYSEVRERIYTKNKKRKNNTVGGACFCFLVEGAATVEDTWVGRNGRTARTLRDSGLLVGAVRGTWQDAR